MARRRRVEGRHLKGRLAKGDRVHVSGRLRTRSWDHDGVTMRRTEIVCRAGAVILLSAKPDARSAAAGEADNRVSAPAPEGADDGDIPFS